MSERHVVILQNFGEMLTDDRNKDKRNEYISAIGKVVRTRGYSKNRDSLFLSGDLLQAVRTYDIVTGKTMLVAPRNSSRERQAAIQTTNNDAYGLLNFTAKLFYKREINDVPDETLDQIKESLKQVINRLV